MKAIFSSRSRYPSSMATGLGTVIWFRSHSLSFTSHYINSMLHGRHEQIRLWCCIHGCSTRKKNRGGWDTTPRRFLATPTRLPRSSMPVLIHLITWTFPLLRYHWDPPARSSQSDQMRRHFAIVPLRGLPFLSLRHYLKSPSQIIHQLLSLMNFWY